MTMYHISKLQLPYLVSELKFTSIPSIDMFSVSDSEYVIEVSKHIHNVETVLEKVKQQIQMMGKEKYEVGLVVNYRLQNELEYDSCLYDSNITGEDVLLTEDGIEHLYIIEVIAPTPQEALEKAINTLTLNKEFEFYNFKTEDDVWIECILTKYEVGFLDDGLMFEYGNIVQEIYPLS